MDILSHYIEELDKANEYVSNNRYSLDMSDSEKVYYNATIRSIRGDIKQANKYMLQNLDELAKDDIKTILQKIVEIEGKFS
ncbi:hypothetical protein AST00_11150 [Staphylococcus equorum]|jgi:site-specific recombinase XerD|uniref:hypothetical protein n=1 Tax=Staphylococcus equorum TaxID=246432 RepID=UPI000852ADFD|nr:hypothetical protein [Staphylococcus equorum]OEK62219.1 hypothetical protein AST00_11150 [Staphylococcus equorum]